MIQVNGFWLPDHETHLQQFLEQGPEFAGGPTYQLHKLLRAMPAIKNFRTALDIGAHCGLWSRVLARMFRTVHAFEPVPGHRNCFNRNIFKDSERATNVNLWPYALGNTAHSCTLHTGPSSSGDTYIKPGGEHQAEMKMLDSFGENGIELPLGDIDFIKIDCEGYELFVLEGGEELIRHHKPCIIVEQKPGKGRQFNLHDTAAVSLLESWGAYKVKEISGDYIMAWR
jgi:FkbM family methyltransferase